MSPRLRRLLSAVATVVLLVVLVLASRDGSDEQVSTASADTTAPTTVIDETDIDADVDETVIDETVVEADDASPAPATDGSECVDGEVEVIEVEELPVEAIDTLELIEADGPFPYRQDGSTFQNREQLLPQHERGYYEEYTVETPGSDDRGARRIVTGDCGDRWYTDDHYDSFSLIVGEP